MIKIRNYIAFLAVLAGILINTPLLSFPLATGYSHGVLIDKEGNVWAWGNNDHGQLGLGHKENLNVPEHPVAQGHNYQDRQGNVWSWGADQCGQPCLGCNLRPKIPTQIPYLHSIVAVYARQHHTFALDSDGDVWAFGSNFVGELGLGDTISHPYPTRVPGLKNIQTLYPFETHTYAIDKDGAVWAWGKNFYGRLGVGDELDHSIPIKIEGLEPLTSLVSSDDHVLALANDGSVWGWGANDKDELAVSGNFEYLAPVCIETLRNKNIVSLFAGKNRSFALDAEGNVWAWGENKNKALRLDDEKTYKIPTLINALKNRRIVQLFPLEKSTLALEDNGNVWTFGLSFGPANNRNIQGSIPTLIKGLKDINFIATGINNIFAVDNSGFVWVLGDNYYGFDCLGLGKDISIASIPTQIPGVEGIKLIIKESGYAFLLDNNSNVWAFGDNAVRQLGLENYRYESKHTIPTLSPSLSSLLQYTSEKRSKRAAPCRATAFEPAEHLVGSSNSDFPRDDVSDPGSFIKDEDALSLVEELSKDSDGKISKEETSSS